jgi:hypothetical protein
MEINNILRRILTMKEFLLTGYEAQLKELEILIDIQTEVRDEYSEMDMSDREFRLIDDEIIKNLFNKEVMRRRIERLKAELKTEEIES